MEEMVDIYDADGNKTGIINSKLNAHKEGLWHISAHVWIYRPDGHILLQKRAAHKETFPSMWDISVAGHIDAGESPLEGALREIREEIGIRVDEKDLEYAYTIRMEYPYPARGWINREHCYVYLMCVDFDADALTLQKEEVEDARFFTLDQFKNMAHADRGMLVPHENYYEHIIDTIVKKTL